MITQPRNLLKTATINSTVYYFLSSIICILDARMLANGWNVECFKLIGIQTNQLSCDIYKHFQTLLVSTISLLLLYFIFFGVYCFCVVSDVYEKFSHTSITIKHQSSK